mmetsp:Transcript_4100/g.14666  ORF Transcript_4100/g.14666 Transcript_4100/m.14666 type:complete len:1218 (-) Transcript_4100:2310-5963(-)
MSFAAPAELHKRGKSEGPEEDAVVRTSTTIVSMEPPTEGSTNSTRGMDALALLREDLDKLAEDIASVAEKVQQGESPAAPHADSKEEGNKEEIVDDAPTDTAPQEGVVSERIEEDAADRMPGLAAALDVPEPEPKSRTEMIGNYVKLLYARFLRRINTPRTQRIVLLVEEHYRSSNRNVKFVIVAALLIVAFAWSLSINTGRLEALFAAGRHDGQNAMGAKPMTFSYESGFREANSKLIYNLKSDIPDIPLHTGCLNNCEVEAPAMCNMSLTKESNSNMPPVLACRFDGIQSSFQGALEESRGHGSSYVLLGMNSDWRFALAPASSRIEDFLSGKLRISEEHVWMKVGLPHTWNALDTVSGITDHASSEDESEVCWYYRGVGLYHAQLHVPPEPGNHSRIWLIVERAALHAAVFLNGDLINEHRGGYTSFVTELGIPASKAPGAESTLDIGIAVSNRHDARIIPSDKNDFFLYGGLTGNTFIEVTGPVRIGSLLVKANLQTEGTKATAATLSLKHSFDMDVAALEEEDVILSWLVVDPSGGLAAKAEKPIGSLSFRASGRDVLIDYEMDLPPPLALWDPESPALYTVRVTVSVNGQVSHAKEERVGLRWTMFARNGLFELNGKALKLWGTNRHDDWSGTGSAVPDRLARREIEQMKREGFNFVRLAHYPQRDVVLRVCDAIGMLVWEELPWSRGGVGDGVWLHQTKDQLREMVQQHYNHPSIIFWGLGNEVDGGAARDQEDMKRYSLLDIEHVTTNTSDVVAVLEVLVHTLRETDPSRLTIYRQMSGRGCQECSTLLDAFSPSIWAGWYNPGYMSYSHRLSQELEKYPRLVHAEYGGSSHIGRHCADHGVSATSAKSGLNPYASEEIKKMPGWQQASGVRHEFTETFMAELLRWTLLTINTTSNLTGTVQWSFKDFATPLRSENPVPCMNQKGLVDRAGRPKTALYVYRAFFGRVPTCHLEGSGVPAAREASPFGKDRLRVWHSGCKKVSLTLNKKVIGEGAVVYPVVPPSVDWNSSAFSKEWDVVLPQGDNQLTVRCSECRGPGAMKRNYDITILPSSTRLPYDSGSMTLKVSRVDHTGLAEGDRLMLAQCLGCSLNPDLPIFRLEAQMQREDGVLVRTCHEKGRRILFEFTVASHTPPYKLYGFQGTVGGSIAIEMSNSYAYIFLVPDDKELDPLKTGQLLGSAQVSSLGGALKSESVNVRYNDRQDSQHTERVD